MVVPGSPWWPLEAEKDVCLSRVVLGTVPVCPGAREGHWLLITTEVL